MVLVIEDGTGRSNAEAYTDVAATIIYLDNLAGPLNAFTAELVEAVQERALRNGANWINRKFKPRFRGTRINATMTMEHPRDGASDIDGYSIPNDAVHPDFKAANAEMALRYLEDTTGHGTSRLDPDIDNPGTLKREMLKADVVEIETEWVGGASDEKQYRTVERILADHLQPAGRVVLA